MAIKFKELRKYLSRVVRLSICFKDGHYDNYHLLSDIPEGKYDELYFGDLRNYLQIGRYFSVMIKGEWKTDYYVMRQDIPDRYDDMLVYGIGIEDNPNAQNVEMINKYGIMDTYLTKSMTLVLEDCANKS